MVQYSTELVIKTLKEAKEKGITSASRENGVKSNLVRSWAKKVGLELGRSTKRDWEYIKSQL